GKPPASMEGTTCMIVMHESALFLDIPFSSIDSNRTNRIYTLGLLEEGACRGQFVENRAGINATSMRGTLADAAPAQRSLAYQERLRKGIDGLEVDSFSTTGVEDIYAPL